MRARSLRIGLGTAAVAAALVTTVVVRAQGDGQGAAPPAKPAIPAAASSIVLRPAAFIGENVSMPCAVEAVLSKTVFTVDQGGAAVAGRDVIVIAPYLNTAVEPNARLTVLGEVFTFDAAEVAKRAPADYVLDLPPDVAARYAGRPAVFARGVVTAELVDIGKRLPPPLSAAEVALRDAMLAISSTNTALRGGLAEPDAAKVKDQVAVLKRGFTTAANFFTARKADDAVGWSADALKFIATMESGAAGAKWDEVRAAAQGLGGLCSSCHTARRERFEDGSYRFKAGQ